MWVVLGNKQDFEYTLIKMETTVSQIFPARQPPYVSAYIYNLARGNTDQTPIVLMGYGMAGHSVFYILQ